MLLLVVNFLLSSAGFLEHEKYNLSPLFHMSNILDLIDITLKRILLLLNILHCLYFIYADSIKDIIWSNYGDERMKKRKEQGSSA